MKILSVIVDEKPNCCGDCTSVVNDSEDCQLCSIVWNEIEDTEKVSSFCPLATMPSDEEIKAFTEEEKIFDYMPETLKMHISKKQESKLAGINWLKSKLNIK